MVVPAPVPGRALQEAGQAGPQRVGAGEEGGHQTEKPPAAPTRVRPRGAVTGGLPHQLAVHLVTQRLETVTGLPPREGTAILDRGGEFRVVPA